ncbi:hypothetical protein HMPREF0262_02048 [Clostridium sp. ATCC 29733]|nr:hypothetical protein HMPREF0262_02048 [Clostridium sp. ATCC 29733]
MSFAPSKRGEQTMKKGRPPGGRRQVAEWFPWGKETPLSFHLFFCVGPPPWRGPVAQVGTPLCPAAQGRKSAAHTGGKETDFCLQPGGGYDTIVSL